MRKSAKRAGRKNGAEQGQRWLRLPGLIRAARDETVIGAGLACVAEALEAERVARCGARYTHAVERQARRAGHAGSALGLGGRRVAVQRPQVRRVAGRELGLPRWREWRARDPLDE